MIYNHIDPNGSEPDDNLSKVLTVALLIGIVLLLITKIITL